TGVPWHTVIKAPGERAFLVNPPVYQEPPGARAAITGRCRNVTITRPDRYHQPAPARVPAAPAPAPHLPAAKNPPPPLNQPLSSANEDETSSVGTDLLRPHPRQLPRVHRWSYRREVIGRPSAYRSSGPSA